MNCPSCGSTRSHYRREYPAAPFGDDGLRAEVTPTVCYDCGLVYLSDPPTDDDLEAHYACQRRWPHSSDAQAEQAEFIARKVPSWTRDNWRVLDIGGYDGRLVREIMQYSPNLLHGVGYYVVEPDASVDPGPGVTRLPVLEAAVQHGPFDLVCMAHTLEHLKRPRETLQFVRDRLSHRGTYLFVEVPTLETPYIQLVPFFTPWHITYWTGGTLHEFLNGCGFAFMSATGTAYGSIRTLLRAGPYRKIRRNLEDIRARHLMEDYEHNWEDELDRIRDRLSALEGEEYIVLGRGEHTWYLQNGSMAPGTVLATVDSTQLQDAMGKWPDAPVLVSSYDSQEELAALVGPRAVTLYDRPVAYDTYRRPA